MNQFRPSLLSIPLGPFRIFPNFAVASQGATPVLLILETNEKNLRSEKLLFCWDTFG
jgi:hypothetical protein